METIVTEKRCSRCGEIKPVSQFYIGSSRGKPRLNSWCKVCFNEKARDYEKRTKDRKNERSRANYQKNIEHKRELGKKHQQTRRDKHREKVNEYQRQWRAKNVEKTREYYREWNKTHRADRTKSHLKWMHKTGMNIVYKAIRRARKYLTGGSYTPQEWKDLCEKYHNRCLCCGEKKPLTADHVLPVSKGGSSNIDNIQPLCKSCNCSKHDRHIDYRP